jgi:hypothetical protein
MKEKHLTFEVKLKSYCVTLGKGCSRDHNHQHFRVHNVVHTRHVGAGERVKKVHLPSRVLIIIWAGIGGRAETYALSYLQTSDDLWTRKKNHRFLNNQEGKELQGWSLASKSEFPQQPTFGGK